MSNEAESQGMRGSSVSESSSSSAWDPYEVWLNRVKKPRDATIETTTIKASGPALSETGTFRILSPTLSR